ncbi:MAG: non-canonical purine NTP pyrophosphatase [Bacteroidales bacterium]|nr:non-canonical purine NTP pyrophosphatase [Bacteroidales bacterium]
MKLIFATGNEGKLREAAQILGEGFELVTPASLGHPEDIPETGTTLASNSLLKARYILDNIGGDCFADDTGLEVEILRGAPGVNTARFAGEKKDPSANMGKLLDVMSRKQTEASIAREYGIDTVHATRKARFVTKVTLFVGGEMQTFEGVMEGRIAVSRSGKGGFGYDPVFIPDRIPAWETDPLKAEPDGDGTVPNWRMLTLAQISDEAKNAISHRGKALREMAAWLKANT